MQWDSWYDLAVRELCDLTDPAKEKLAEAEETRTTAPSEREEPPAPEPPQS